MYLYSISFNLEESLFEQWKTWLTDRFIVTVEDIGFQQQIVFFELLSQHQAGRTFILQIYIDNYPLFATFETHQLIDLKRELHETFGESLVYFESILKQLSTATFH